jgi:asparagine synthase (glutamine-hydrolysing)
MCGVAAIWRFGDPLTDEDLSDLRAMTSALQHRGPDGEGYWSHANVGFGHRRLSILDRTDKAAQPMNLPDGTGVLTYNGEVYNFDSLRVELERDGVQFRSNGDTEVVLRALERWGPTVAVPRFNGMFAFAYYDATSETLWLARDRLGIKPLSYLRQGGRILMASEDKAILRARGVVTRIDPLAMALRFIRLNEANGTSLFSQIDRLEPGTIMKINRSGTEEIRYWDPITAFDTSRLLADGASAREQHLEQLVRQSVHMHLAADTDVAACLSGGVDSGLVTAIAAQERPGIQAFVADPYVGPNESAAAERTANRSGVRLSRVSISRNEFLRNWPKTVFAVESIGYSQGTAALLAITQRARSNGIPVLLTGEGADELFGGYPRYLASRNFWRRLDPPRNWFMRKRRLDAMRFRASAVPFADSIVLAKSGGPVPHLIAAAPNLTLLQRKCARAVTGLAHASSRGLVAARLYDLMTHLQELLHRHDRLGMAASVETRVPFLENELIDFGINLHPRDLVRSRTPKPLLKKVAEKYLPRQNVYATKLGFAVSTEFSRGSEVLLKNGNLRDVMRWKAGEVEDVVEHAKSHEGFRYSVVGAELCSRIFGGGATPENLGELLVSTSDCRQDGVGGDR